MANRYEKSENIFKEKFQVPDDMDDDLFEIAAGLPLRNKNREMNQNQLKMSLCRMKNKLSWIIVSDFPVVLKTDYPFFFSIKNSKT